MRRLIFNYSLWCVPSQVPCQIALRVTGVTVHETWVQWTQQVRYDIEGPVFVLFWHHLFVVHVEDCGVRPTFVSAHLVRFWCGGSLPDCVVNIRVSRQTVTRLVRTIQ